MFRLNPDSTSRFPLFKDLYENRFLFWAVAIGAVSVFPAVYIPVLNTDVFKMVGISWEWGVVFGMTVVYILGVELWKYVKRTTGILDDYKVVHGKWSQGSEEGRKFTKSLSVGSLRSWKSWAKGDLRGRTNGHTLTNSNTLTNGGTVQGGSDLSRGDTIV